MTTSATAAVLGSFSTVDSTADVDALVAALEEQASIPAIQRLRVAATELLGVRLGHHVADVGCGTGDLARTLAGRVGRTGGVVAIDRSETMLTEARRRRTATTLPVEFRVGDIINLALPSAAFDGTVCERVFQHLASPRAAMAELVRITRPGGRIVVIDTDWGLHAIHGADPALTATIIEAWAHNATNGFAGRQLCALLADAGMREPTVVAETITSTDPRQPLVAPFTAMATVAVAAGAVNDNEAEHWLAELVAAGEQGRFFWAVTMFGVGATRPASVSAPG